MELLSSAREVVLCEHGAHDTGCDVDCDECHASLNDLEKLIRDEIKLKQTSLKRIAARDASNGRGGGQTSKAKSNMAVPKPAGDLKQEHLSTSGRTPAGKQVDNVVRSSRESASVVRSSREPISKDKGEVVLRETEEQVRKNTSLG